MWLEQREGEQQESRPQGWHALRDSGLDSGRRTLGRESCDLIYVSTRSLCSRIIVPKAVQGPCLQDPWPCCTTQQKGIKMADGSKAGNQVTLRWGDYHLSLSGLSGWAHCIGKGE